MKNEIIQALEAKGFTTRTQTTHGGEQVIISRPSSTVYFTIDAEAGTVVIRETKRNSTSGKRSRMDLAGTLNKIKRMRKA